MSAAVVVWWGRTVFVEFGLVLVVVSLGAVVVCRMWKMEDVAAAA